MMVASKMNIFNFSLSGISNGELVNIRDKCLNSIKLLSCLRLFNSMSSITGCKEFSALGAIGDFSNCLVLDDSSLISYVKNNIESNILNPSISTADASTIKNSFFANMNNMLSRDVYDISNGHDFNKAFIYFVGQKGVTLSEKLNDQNSIYNYYQSAFSSLAFLNTRLFNSIKEYETSNNLIFLA